MFILSTSIFFALLYSVPAFSLSSFSVKAHSFSFFSFSSFIFAFIPISIIPISSVPITFRSSDFVLSFSSSLFMLTVSPPAASEYFSFVTPPVPFTLLSFSSPVSIFFSVFSSFIPHAFLSIPISSDETTALQTESQSRFTINVSGHSSYIGLFW